MENDEQQLDIYKIDTKAKIDKRKLLFVILIIIAILLIFSIGIYIGKTIKQYRDYKQNEIRQIMIKKQEAEDKAKIEAEKERKRQEKIPKLTEVRKTKCKKYL